MIEIAVKETEDRLILARVLLKNGYRVWFENRKHGKITKPYVCAERMPQPAKEEG